MQGELGKGAGDHEGEDGGQVGGDQGNTILFLVDSVINTLDQFNGGHDWSNRAV